MAVAVNMAASARLAAPQRLPVSQRAARQSVVRSPKPSGLRVQARKPLRVSAVATNPATDPGVCDVNNLLEGCFIQETNQLESLRKMSKVVADTGEIAMIKKYRPEDATTNPSLILKAAVLPEYADVVRHAMAEGRNDPPGLRPFSTVVDRLAVEFGSEILKLIPGRVSTEVDAHLSYDTKATVDKALFLLDLYAKKGISQDRVYIKIASTWEGIRACEILQKQGIECNMTLLFSFAQAVGCAEAGAGLISPFVGRILDWYKKHEGRDFTPDEDPGVQSVKRIYSYYKKFGYRTIVMAASFRNAGEIRELAGCDNITISPPLLEELQNSFDPLICKLTPGRSKREPWRGGCIDEQVALDEAKFRELHGGDQMAVDKLTEGIEGFSKDQEKLEAFLATFQ